MHPLDNLLLWGLPALELCAILSQRIHLFIGRCVYLRCLFALVFVVSATKWRSFDGRFAVDVTNVLDLVLSCWRGSLARIARIIVTSALILGNAPVLRFGIAFALIHLHVARDDRSQIQNEGHGQMFKTEIEWKMEATQNAIRNIESAIKSMEAVATHPSDEVLQDGVYAPKAIDALNTELVALRAIERKLRSAIYA